MPSILHRILVMTDTPETGYRGAGHPTSSAIAAFVDRRLHGEEREALLAHFASCTECRREMTDVRAAVGMTARQARTGGMVIARWPVVVAGLAAVLLLAVRLPRTGPVRAADAPPITRTPASEPVVDPALLGVVAPLDEQPLAADRMLAWHAGGGDATYQVTVQDSTGAAVWSASLADTSVGIPDSARLVTGARYFWSVDVRRADGSTSRSGVHRFVAP